MKEIKNEGLEKKGKCEGKGRNVGNETGRGKRVNGNEIGIREDEGVVYEMGIE